MYSFNVACVFLVGDILKFCFFFKQKTAYEMRISDWSSDVCSSDLIDLVTNGIEACEQVQKAPYDLVLMDVQMPEMDGIAATQEIGRASCRERVCQYV